MQYKVDEILDTKLGDFQGLTKITLTLNGELAYMFCKPGNEPSVGDTLDGGLTKDKSGNNKFTKTKNQEWAAQGAPQPYTGPKAGVSAFIPRDDKAIQAQWSIGQAVQLNLASATERSFDLIEADAVKFFAMIDRVKNPQTTLPLQPTKDVVPTDVDEKTIEEFFGGKEL